MSEKSIQKKVGPRRVSNAPINTLLDISLRGHIIIHGLLSGKACLSRRDLSVLTVVRAGMLDLMVKFPIDHLGLSLEAILRIGFAFPFCTFGARRGCNTRSKAAVKAPDAYPPHIQTQPRKGLESDRLCLMRRGWLELAEVAWSPLDEESEPPRSRDLGLG
uniref:Uncharacterized protein n=1 Tax=Cannabis sativa TaxID=3483 RepID=A0A803Q132_CANSA